MGNKVIFLTGETEEIWKENFKDKGINFSDWVRAQLLSMDKTRHEMSIEEIDNVINNLSLDKEKIENDIKLWNNRKLDILSAEKLEEKKKEDELESIRNSLRKYFDITEEQIEKVLNIWLTDKSKNYNTIAEKMGIKDRVLDKVLKEDSPVSGDSNSAQGGEKE